MTELPSYNLARLAPPDIRAYLREKKIVMIPIASMEQHGAHLPLSTDTIQAEEVARRAGERAKVLYTPCVWMGYSPQHMYEPGQGTGTITVRSQVLLELWYDIARSLIHHGFDRLLACGSDHDDPELPGVVLAFRNDFTLAYIALTPLLAMFATTLLYYGSGRFRDSLAPNYVLFGAYALVSVWHIWRQSKQLGKPL